MTDDRVHHHRFPPDADLAEALNAALDGYAPASTPPPDVSELLAIARTARATPLDAGEDASPARLDALWDGILRASQPRQVSAPSEAVAVAFHAGPARLAVPRTLGARSGRRRSGLRTVTSWLSMAAVIVVLVGMGSMAWSLRPGGGDHSLLASATSLAVGTASASPSPMATPAWMRWPVPEDCDVAPMAHEDYAEIMRTQPDISGRSYEVAGVPTQADAEAAADVARRQFACDFYSLRDQGRTLSSPAYLFFQSDSSARTISRTELTEADLAHGMQLSVAIVSEDPRAYVGVPEGTPPASVGEVSWPYWDPLVEIPAGLQFSMALAFDPAHVTALADGRIAIPATMLGFSPDRQSMTTQELDALDVVAPPLYVMAKTPDGWVVDEVLTYCPFPGCGPVWSGLAEDGGVPVPTLDVPAPWTIPTGTATPVASPAHEGTSTPAT